MKKLALLLVGIFILGLSTPIYASQPADISVKIGATRSSVRLESTNGFELIQSNGKKIRISTATLQLSPYGQDQIQVKSAQGEYKIEENVDRIQPQNNNASVDGKRYRGSFYFINSGNLLSVVNQLPVEEYLKGVLPKEIGTSTNREALKAQAVVSRSFAYANYNKFLKNGYNLDDTTSSQVYGGMDVESEATNQAVEATRGQVLYYGDSIANTIFHATSGGKTEAIEDVWGGNSIPYLKVQEDPYSVNTRNSTWEATISKSELNNKYSGKVGEVTGFKILERTSSNRIRWIEITGTNGSYKISGNQFRLDLGAVKIKSTDFTVNGQGSTLSEQVITSTGRKTFNGLERIISATGITERSSQTILTANGQRKIQMAKAEEIQGEEFYLQGRGYGHGVGMSQYGAINMGNDGKDYRYILGFYYPGTEIR